MADKTTAFTGPVVVGLNDKKGEIRLTDGKNVNEAKYLAIAAPDTITSNTTLTFPNSAGSNGQFLKTDGNGELTWSTPNTGGIAAVVDDTAPELGGDLASNGHDIDFADGDKAKFGDSGDLEIFHDGTNSLIKDVGTGQLKISGFDAVKITNGDDTIPSAQFISSGEAQLYYAGSQKLAANTDGIAVTGKIGINDTTPSRALTIGGGSDAKIQFKEGGTQSLYFGDSGSDFAGFINYNHSDNRMKISASDTVELQSSAADITLTDKVRIQNSYDLPNSDGTAGQVMTTDGAGNVTFQTPSGGGISWQPVITTNTTATASQGFFVNTSGGVVTLTLPATPTQGDEVAFVDYAGTAATNNITIGRNGENIQGSASDLIINTNRAANTLVYADATQGWLLKNV